MSSKSSGRFISVNGNEILRHRRALGWTQRELAKAAGYSDRLIRKAEKGGRLEVATVQNLAEALSTLNAPVTFEMLTHDPLSIARNWMRALENLGAQMLPEIEATLSDDVVFVCSGDSVTPSFAEGVCGKDGFQRWLACLFEVYERDRATDVEYMTGDNTVVIRWMKQPRFAQEPSGPRRVSMHLTFVNGRITRMEVD